MGSAPLSYALESALCKFGRSRTKAWFHDNGIAMRTTGKWASRIAPAAETACHEKAWEGGTYNVPEIKFYYIIGYVKEVQPSRIDEHRAVHGRYAPDQLKDTK